MSGENEAGPALGAAASSSERGSSQIGIDSYDSRKDDFNEWVERFENAVEMATNAQSQASLHKFYKKWLPLRMDRAARAVLKQTT